MEFLKGGGISLCWEIAGCSVAKIKSFNDDFPPMMIVYSMIILFIGKINLISLPEFIAFIWSKSCSLCESPDNQTCVDHTIIPFIFHVSLVVSYWGEGEQLWPTSPDLFLILCVMLLHNCPSETDRKKKKCSGPISIISITGRDVSHWFGSDRNLIKINKKNLNGLWKGSLFNAGGEFKATGRQCASVLM